jgi:hypothetical protein
MGWFGNPSFFFLYIIYLICKIKFKKNNILMDKKQCVFKKVTTVNKIGQKDFMVGVDVPMPLIVKKKKKLKYIKILDLQPSFSLEENFVPIYKQTKQAMKKENRKDKRTKAFRCGRKLTAPTYLTWPTLGSLAVLATSGKVRP